MYSAPGFWGERPGFLANLLLPVGAAWSAAGWIAARANAPLSIPRSRWCVSAIWSPAAPARRRWHWHSPPSLPRAASQCTSSRAVMAAASAGPVRVDPACHDAVAVGDEALLLAAIRTLLGRPRPRGR